MSGEDTQIRWGFISTARIGKNALMPAITRSRNGEVRAIASRTKVKAQAFAKAHDIPVAYGQYEDLIDDPDIDAIYNPLPNHLHKEWTIRAMEAGKHVLCEKPLALNADEAQEMAEAADRAGVTLMEAFMWRFHPRSRRVKELVERGAVGDVRLIRAAFCFKLGRTADIRLDPEMGGGALLDVGCYCVNTVRWMYEEEPEEVQAFAEYGPTGVDVAFAGALRFPGDRLAVIQVAFTTVLQQTYTIVGTEGTIHLPDGAYLPGEDDVILRLGGIGGREETIPGADEYQVMVEHFHDVMLGKSELAFPPQEAVRNMRVLDALATAAREKRLVTVAS